MIDKLHADACSIFKMHFQHGRCLSRSLPNPWSQSKGPSMQLLLHAWPALLAGTLGMMVRLVLGSN
jgi:hypothetical protein